jgi:hypothetical protein
MHKRLILPVLFLAATTFITSACSLIPSPSTDPISNTLRVSQTAAASFEDAILATLSYQATHRVDLSQRSVESFQQPVVIPTGYLTPAYQLPGPTAPYRLTPPAAVPAVPGTANPTRVVTATPTPAAALPAPVNMDPQIRLGAPTWLDDLNNARNWPVGWDDFTNGYIQNGSLVLTGITNLVGWRIGTTPELVDFYYEANFQTAGCYGNDAYGIIFRVPVKRQPDQGYLFFVNCQGYYALKNWDKWAGPAGRMDVLIDWQPSSAIQAGSGRENRIGVLAAGNYLTLFINGRPVNAVIDNTYRSGYAGVLVQSGSPGNPYTVQVNQAAYWTNLEYMLP